MCELENNELTLRKIYEIENEEERVKAIYELFNEDKRLNISNSTRVEFLTVVNCLSKYLYNGDKILEIGAGTGKYSLYFASLGYSVTSVELSKKKHIYF